MSRVGCHDGRGREQGARVRPAPHRRRQSRACRQQRTRRSRLHPQGARFCSCALAYAGPILCSQDMPRLDAHLHYRILDVSSIKELARRWYPKTTLPGKGDSAHRSVLLCLLCRRTPQVDGHAAEPCPTSTTRSTSCGTIAATYLNGLAQMSNDMLCCRKATSPAHYLNTTCTLRQSMVNRGAAPSIARLSS